MQVYPDALRIDEQLVDHCSLKGNQFVSGATAGVQIGSPTTARVGEGGTWAAGNCIRGKGNGQILVKKIKILEILHH